VCGYIGDDHGQAPMRRGPAGADALTGADAVNGPVVEVGQAGSGAVAQVGTVGVGHQYGDECPGKDVFNGDGHALEDLFQGCVAGDLFQERLLLRGQQHIMALGVRRYLTAVASPVVPRCS
jgi:hypothetical protein